jgi:hypothetical protein
MGIGFGQDYSKNRAMFLKLSDQVVAIGLQTPNFGRIISGDKKQLLLHKIPVWFLPVAQYCCGLLVWDCYVGRITIEASSADKRCHPITFDYGA